MPTSTKTASFRAHKRRNLALAAALLAVIVIGGGLLLWHSTNTTSKTTAPSAPTKSPSGSDKQYATTQGEPTTPSQTSTSSATTATTSLASPSGQLLNVQTVSLSSGPSLESVCQTIANASCDIRLTQSGTTKYIGAQSTGSNGMVIFDWNAKTVGLTTGQWNVQAVVTQNGTTGVSHTEYLTVQP